MIEDSGIKWESIVWYAHGVIHGNDVVCTVRNSTGSCQWLTRIETAMGYCAATSGIELTPEDAQAKAAQAVMDFLEFEP